MKARTRGLCSNCEKETEFEIAAKDEVISVRREPVKVRVQYFRCVECGDEVLAPELGEDPFDLAYREYRKNHRLLRPEEIRDWRRAHGLTQAELAKLLGLGMATMSRYENGALQDESHERLFRLAMEPASLLKLVERSENVMPEAKKTRLLQGLQDIEADLRPADATIIFRFGTPEPSWLNGYRRLDLAKLYSAILFFCKGGVFKTKLNKLLFYADFRHFKEYAVSITGAQYAHIPFGPAPDSYDMFYADLRSKRALELMERQYPNGAVGEIVEARKEPDLTLFSSSELHVMAAVKEDFKNHNASKMTQISHTEAGYKETQDGDIISYKYARQLNY